MLHNFHWVLYFFHDYTNRWTAKCIEKVSYINIFSLVTSNACIHCNAALMEQLRLKITWKTWLCLKRGPAQRLRKKIVVVSRAFENSSFKGHCPWLNLFFGERALTSSAKSNNSDLDEAMGIFSSGWRKWGMLKACFQLVRAYISKPWLVLIVQKNFLNARTKKVSHDLKYWSYAISSTADKLD